MSTKQYLIACKNEGKSLKNLKYSIMNSTSNTIFENKIKNYIVNHEWILKDLEENNHKFTILRTIKNNEESEKQLSEWLTKNKALIIVQG